jgi:hypothetical protein
MALPSQITQVFQYVATLPDKRTAFAMNKVFEKVFPRVRIANVTTATVSLADPANEGKTTTLNRAAGIAVTLPTSTGLGGKYRLVVGTTFTGSATVKVANHLEIMMGSAQQTGAAGATTSFLVGATHDTITMNGTTTGGLQGDIIELEDVALGVWSVKYVGSITGTAATPFSQTV